MLLAECGADILRDGTSVVDDVDNGYSIVGFVNERRDNNDGVNIFILSLIDDDGDGDAMSKDVCGHHFNVSRTTEIARRLPRIWAWVVRIFSPVQHVYGNFLIRKPTLPAYYNFLFRLSPF